MFSRLMLPFSGMWDTLNSNSIAKSDSAAAQTVDNFIKTARDEQADDRRFDDSQEDNSRGHSSDAHRNEDFAMPTGFGRGPPGRRKDFSKEFGGNKKGLERDAKGKDWDCPSCGNVNWSWRGTCNKCNTARPSTVIVSCLPLVVLVEGRQRTYCDLSW